jgi:hypothetical protein
VAGVMAGALEVWRFVRDTHLVASTARVAST